MTAQAVPLSREPAIPAGELGASPRRRSGERILVPLAFLIVCWLQWRFFAQSLTHPVFHRDEANDVFTALQPWGELWRHFITDWVPYVYLLSVRLWVGLFGTGEAVVRFLSLLSIWAADIVIYRALKRWWGDRSVAVAGVATIGLSPVVVLHPVIDFARPYAMALFLAGWMFERFVALTEEGGRKRWWWMGGVSFLACNIQPVNLGFAAALPVAWFIREWREKRLAAGGWQKPFLLAVVIAAVSLPTVIQASRFRSGQGDEKASLEGGIGRYYAESAFRMVGWVAPWAPAVVSYALDDDPAGGPEALQANAPWDVVACVALVAVVLAMLAVQSGAWKWQDTAAVWLGLACIVFLATAGLGSARMVVSWKCYSGLALGLTMLLLALLRHSRLAVIAVIAITLVRAATSFAADAVHKTGMDSDGKDAVAFIESRERPDDLILLANLVLSPTFSYYYHGTNEQVHHPYAHGLKVWHAFQLWQDIGETQRVSRTLQFIADAAAERRRIWFVAGGLDVEHQAPEGWHRWYSPDAYVACLAALSNGFERIDYRAFRETEEPFYVSLYTPVRSSP